jgi:hypothetical protein
MNNNTCGDCFFYNPKMTRNGCGMCTATTGLFKGMYVDPTMKVCVWACTENVEKKPIPPLTNGDKIRQMNTSGLMDVIVCPHPDKDCIHRNMNGYACRCCKRDWLNAPADAPDTNVGTKESEVEDK